MSRLWKSIQQLRQIKSKLVISRDENCVTLVGSGVRCSKYQ
jgi:hypothetical protein